MRFKRRMMHAINRPFQLFVARMRAIAVRRNKVGANSSPRKIAEDLRLKTLRLSGKENSKQWHRWYKANRQHQRRFRAARQMGWNLGPTPHSLKREWVR